MDQRQVVDREPDADRVAAERTALDYFEGWFDGDPARMERALHPELAKRSRRRVATWGIRSPRGR